jgi:hypothetical protein
MRTLKPCSLLALVAVLMSGGANLAQAEQQAFIRTVDDPGLEWLPCFPHFPESCRFAVLQGDPAKPNADIFLRLEPNSEVPLHWHTSAERIVLIAGEFEVDYDGQDPVVLTAGTYAYGPARLPHSATCKDAGRCILFIAFEEPVDAPEGRPDSGPDRERQRK